MIYVMSNSDWDGALRSDLERQGIDPVRDLSFIHLRKRHEFEGRGHRAARARRRRWQMRGELRGQDHGEDFILMVKPEHTDREPAR